MHTSYANSRLVESATWTLINTRQRTARKLAACTCLHTTHPKRWRENAPAHTRTHARPLTRSLSWAERTLEDVQTRTHTRLYAPITCECDGAIIFIDDISLCTPAPRACPRREISELRISLTKHTPDGQVDGGAGVDPERNANAALQRTKRGAYAG